MSEKITDTEFYNMASAEKLGWEPYWFCVEGFGSELDEAVRRFQEEHGLTVDGLVGPMTFSRIYTERISDEEETSQHNIIFDGKKIPIDWPKVDTEKYMLPSKNYKEVRGARDIHEIVTHWDATLSAKHCYNILLRRGISTHFCIDNDGTIYQMVDPKNVAWHVRGHNNHTIGVDFSNAYYLKYNDRYEKMGFPRRPILNSKVHGVALGEHLGYYPIQIKAYKKLIKTLTDYSGIPLRTPTDAKGNLMRHVYSDALHKKFEGIICHYHLTRNKIDCAGLELTKIIEEIREEE